MAVSNCIFCKIAVGEIPTEAVHASEDFLAFRDIVPQAPVHVVVIPRIHRDTIMDVEDPQLFAGLLAFVQETAVKLGVDAEGFRSVINCRANGGQTISHLHVHLLGGRFLNWPPG